MAGTGEEGYGWLMAGVATRTAARTPPLLRRGFGFAAALALAAATLAAAPADTTGRAGGPASGGSPAAVSTAPGAPAPLHSLAAPLPSSAASLPALPAKWPSTNLEVGLVDSPGGAAALHASGAYKFRYQYLCGGVNTGSGWATWNDNAKFADYYVDESVAQGITPVFIYYQMLQSSPAGGAENVADLNNLKNATTMKAYWADVRLLFQHLGAYSQTILIDVEPDLWGYIEQAATGDNAASIPAAVASSGDAEMAGLANNAAGFAQAFIRLRDKYAPNVLLGYHMSIWGTNTDIIYSNSSNAEVDALAARSATFEKSLGAGFDIAFGDPTDRDAEFHHIINGQTQSWWSTADYAAYDRYLGDFVAAAGLRMVLWQIPLGNTKMRAMDNTWGHYQDNHVEWWLDDSTATHLASTVNAGVVALLFGGGADGTTSAWDFDKDGVTNPAAIDGNNQVSYSADDDGGFFRHQTNVYYSAGALALPGTAAPPVVTSTYHPVPPVRLLDSRYANGLSGKFTAGVPRPFQVTGRGGSSNVPAGATAVTANVTIVNSSATSSVYLGPDPLPNPPTFTINFNKGQVTAYGSTIALSSSGSISVTYMAGSGTTDLVVDVTGYFTPDDTGDTYYPLAPARLLDTRVNNGLGGKFKINAPREFHVTGRGGVPAKATAVTGNLTVTDATGSWAAYIGPDPIAKPGSSTINFVKGQTRANSLTVQLSSTGTLWATFMGSGKSTIDLVFDVTGYYAADLDGARYVPVTPHAVLDTRSGSGLSGKFAASSPRTFGVWNRGGVPATATGVSGIVSVYNQTNSWAVFVGPAQIAKPLNSSLNFVKGDNCSNGFTIALSGTGTMSATYLSSAGNTTNIVVEITGYFVP
jgi:hypothetical protein